MHRKQLFILAGSIALTACVVSILARAAEPAAEPTPTPSRLAVVWTSGDPDVAHRVCFMYTHNAAKNKWFGEVRLIVWVPSSRLLAGDKDLQAKIKTMIKDGVTVQACIACADSYGVTDTLRGLGIEVKGMGRPLTDMLQSNYKVLTF
jgi:hypothetical protein